MLFRSVRVTPCGLTHSDPEPIKQIQHPNSQIAPTHTCTHTACLRANIHTLSPTWHSSCHSPSLSHTHKEDLYHRALLSHSKIGFLSLRWQCTTVCCGSSRNTHKCYAELTRRVATVTDRLARHLPVCPVSWNSS